jgi:multidrug efflux pump subunit AcrA (membrane-fusion protein)
MNWRKITFVVVALIVLLGGSAALSMMFVSMKPEPPRIPDNRMKRFVKAETVAYTDIVSPLSREGRMVSSNEVMLVAEASGKILAGQVSLRKGTSFRKGQLIASIYSDEVELAIKARKSHYLTILSNLLPDIKIDYPDKYESFLRFFNSIEMDKKLPELPEIKDEKIKIFLSSRSVISEYYGIQQDEKRLERHKLFAPFNGTVAQVNFEVGAYVNTGGQIAKLIRTDELEVEVPVENGQSQWIKIGDKVQVFSQNREIVKTGVVVRKSDFVDPSSQGRSIFVRVNNNGGEEIYTGEYKLVVFPGQMIQKAMEIPRNAVFNSNEVFTIVNGTLKKKTVNVLKWNETTLIFNGLEEGEKIVAEPLINAKENTPVGILGEEVPTRQKGPGKQGNPNS